MAIPDAEHFCARRRSTPSSFDGGECARIHGAISPMQVPEMLPETFLRSFALRSKGIMWLLGAGASASAGIPTAWHFIWEFKRALYCSRTRRSPKTLDDLSSPQIQQFLQQHFDDAGRYPPLGADEEYPFYFEETYPSDRDRRRYIEEKVAGGKPSFGHLALAALLKGNKCEIVWTTNFDRVIEDACAAMAKTTSWLRVASIDAPHQARLALSETTYPMLVKLHGDFHSRRLKNTAEELRAQDAEMRKSLSVAGRTHGLAVVGYSGRDNSIMDALEDVLDDVGGYPNGLFWFHRGDSPPSERVNRLIKMASDAGTEAHLVKIDTFDELFADLLRQIADLPPDVAEILQTRDRRTVRVPLPTKGGGYPALRLNAIPVLDWPRTCRVLECDIGGTRVVREALVTASASKSVAVRSSRGVLAFGQDDELKRAFEPFRVRRFDLHAIDAGRLTYESAEHGLIYEALALAFERQAPVRSVSGRSGHILVVEPSKNQERLTELITCVSGRQICGVIPKCGLKWAEAVQLRIEFRMDTLWAVLLPTVWAERPLDEPSARLRADFIRERQATRYNPGMNALVSAWVSVLLGAPRSGEEQRRQVAFSTFDVSDGVDARFVIGSLTAFSWRNSSHA